MKPQEGASSSFFKLFALRCFVGVTRKVTQEFTNKYLGSHPPLHPTHYEHPLPTQFILLYSKHRAQPEFEILKLH